VRAFVLSGFVGVALATNVVAETAFIVDAEGLIECNNLGMIAEGFAEHKHAGVSEDEMRIVMQAGDVDPAVADLMVQTIYSFDADDMQSYNSIVGALCVLDRLQPIEIER
jgi:hypothetical protein